MLNEFELFDSHLHIIDPIFPLIANSGFLPKPFTCQDYLKQTQDYNLTGGVIVSGSFQAFDQTYLLTALNQLGPTFVGVTQLPHTTTRKQLELLNKSGVRGIRFNLKRGGSESFQHLDSVAKRVYETVGWHTELYIDSGNLEDLYHKLSTLPALSIDHLGLSHAGHKTLLRLVEQGVRVKATGFGRVDFDIPTALKEIYNINPDALMFGTDLPCTRAKRPYREEDFSLVVDTLGKESAKKVLCDNAKLFYRISI